MKKELSLPVALQRQLPGFPYEVPPLARRCKSPPGGGAASACGKWILINKRLDVSLMSNQGNKSSRTACCTISFMTSSPHGGQFGSICIFLLCLPAMQLEKTLTTVQNLCGDIHTEIYPYLFLLPNGVFIHCAGNHLWPCVSFAWFHQRCNKQKH